LTERVLGAIFEISNTLGAGFLEKVYQRALLTELRLRGIRVTAEASLKCAERLCIVHGFQVPMPIEALPTLG
jgi:GxxExxY protein